MQEDEEQQSQNNRKIGVEIETSALKVSLNGGDNNYSGFIIKKLDGTPLWSIEQDTTDKSEFTDNNNFKYNIEFKTHDGFDSNQEFLEILGLMKHVLKTIYEKAESCEFWIKPNSLNPLIGNEEGDKYKIDKVNDGQRKFTVKRRTPNHQLVRPQITYQLPLNEILRVFQRLEILKHPRIVAFLASLNNNTPQYTVPQRTTEMPKLAINKYRTWEILNIFSVEFSEALKPSNQNITDNVRGFSYLFLYYWMGIFNNNQIIENKEPGLKPFLPLMSRIPFSQMYDQGLSGEEKEQFNLLFNPKILLFGDIYKIREYVDYSDEAVGCQLTLKDWYESVVKTETRQELEKESTSGEFISCFVDLLSPRPICLKLMQWVGFTGI